MQSLFDEHEVVVGATSMIFALSHPKPDIVTVDLTCDYHPVNLIGTSLHSSRIPCSLSTGTMKLTLNYLEH